MSPNVPLVAWMPDADLTQPGVLADVYNMLPTSRGYAAEFTLSEAIESTVAGGLEARCYGAARLNFSTFTPILVAGTTNKLFACYGNSYNDVSGATYTPITDPQEAWRFDAFGDTALAVSAQNALQYTDDVYSTDFAAVSGAPKAATMCVQSNFVLLANTQYNGATHAYGDGWWCSALGDYSDWSPDLATQCDRGRLLQTPGEIIRLIAFRNEVIAFKRHSMLRGVWVNRPAQGTIWQWSVISTTVGIVGHDAVCDAGGVLYWIAEDGFYRYAGGGVERIANAPWRWWQANSSDNIVWRTYTQAAWDPVWRCVRWWYVPYQQYTTELTGGLALHVDSGRWGRFEADIEWVAPTYYQYVRTPSLPDDVTIQRGALVVFESSDHKPMTWTEEPAESWFVTGDFGDDDQVTTLTGTRVRWATAPDTTVGLHTYRMALGSALTTGAEVAPGGDGIYPFTQAARWHRVTFTQTGWCELLGVSVESPKQGRK